MGAPGERRESHLFHPLPVNIAHPIEMANPAARAKAWWAKTK